MKKFKQLYTQILEDYTEGGSVFNGFADANPPRTANAYYGNNEYGRGDTISRLNAYIHKFLMGTYLEPNAAVRELRIRLNHVGLDFPFDGVHVKLNPGINSFPLKLYGDVFGTTPTTDLLKQGFDRGSNLPNTSLEIACTYDEESCMWMLKGRIKVVGRLDESFMDWVQGGLDAVGFIPGVGDVVDLANAGISGVRAALDPERRAEHLMNAGLRAASAIPIVGDAAKVGIYAGKAAKLAGKVAPDLANVAGKVGGALKSAGSAVGSAVGKATDAVGSVAGKAADLASSAAPTALMGAVATAAAPMAGRVGSAVSKVLGKTDDVVGGALSSVGPALTSASSRVAASRTGRALASGASSVAGAASRAAGAVGRGAQRFGQSRVGQGLKQYGQQALMNVAMGGGMGGGMAGPGGGSEGPAPVGVDSNPGAYGIAGRSNVDRSAGSIAMRGGANSATVRSQSSTGDDRQRAALRAALGLGEYGVGKQSSKMCEGGDCMGEGGTINIIHTRKAGDAFRGPFRGFPAGEEPMNPVAMAMYEEKSATKSINTFRSSGHGKDTARAIMHAITRDGDIRKKILEPVFLHLNQKKKKGQLTVDQIKRELYYVVNAAQRKKGITLSKKDKDRVVNDLVRNFRNYSSRMSTNPDITRRKGKTKKSKKSSD